MKPIHKRIFLLVFFLVGMLVFVVFSHMRPLFGIDVDPYGRLGLIVFIAVLIMVCSSNVRFREYRSIFIAYMIAMIAMTLDLYIPTISWALEKLNIPILTPLGITLDKLDSSVILILVIVILNRFTGGSFKTIGLTMGKSNLRFGIVAFLVSLILAIPLAGMFGAVDLTYGRIVGWAPLLLIFVFANALNEELLFRSLFLFKLQPIYGKTIANLVLVLPFVLHHTGVEYTSDILLFFMILTPLSLIWGHLTLKSGNIYSALLFHAGTDIPIALALFSKL